ncbi:MAG: Zn-dependent alcohol dehydrogenase [Aliiglaciecola sp.]
MLCNAIVSDGQGKFALDEIKIGSCGPDEICVKIAAAGICHTDYDSILNWNKRFVVGHEGAGVVTATGAKITDIEVGDHVALNWAVPCGECFQCREGNLHICELNSPVCGNGLYGHAHADACQSGSEPIERSFHLGTMSEYSIVKRAAVVKMDKSIPFSCAAIVGCGVMTGWGSVVNAAKVVAGSSVCVLGVGGVGLNAIQGACLAGAVKIIAIDISEDRLNQAKEFGATHGILADRKDLNLTEVVNHVRTLTEGRGADYAFECTAIPALGSAPLRLVRSAGTAVQVSGIEQHIDFDCELFEWDKVYINPLYGKCNPQRDFPLLFDLYKSKRLLLDELITKTYTLETFGLGIEDMLAGKLAKGVVIIDKTLAGA